MTTPFPGNATTEGLTHASRLVNDSIHSLMALRVVVAKEKGDRETYNALWEVVRTLNEAVNTLTRNGAGNPDGVKPRVDLVDIARLDTPDSRELLELLTRTLAVAERVDAQRGNFMPDYEPGDLGSRGTDYAESVSHLACRLSMEIEPPKGRD